MYKNLDRKYPQVYAILSRDMDKRKAKRVLRNVHQKTKSNVGWAFEIVGFGCGLINDNGFVSEFVTMEIN